MPLALPPLNQQAVAARAIAASEARWPASPCRDAATVSFVPDPYADDIEVNGLAYPGACRAVIRHGPPAGQACSVALHELGHLAGVEHSTDPGSVMFPGDTPMAPECAVLNLTGRQTRRVVRAIFGVPWKIAFCLREPRTGVTECGVEREGRGERIVWMFRRADGRIVLGQP